MNDVQLLLVCLMEELNEVSQEISKCLRFTLDHKYPGYVGTNVERLRLEVADVYAIVRLLEQRNVFIGLEVPGYLEPQMLKKFMDKITKTRESLEISRELGVLK